VHGLWRTGPGRRPAPGGQTSWIAEAIAPAGRDGVVKGVRVSDSGVRDRGCSAADGGSHPRAIPPDGRSRARYSGRVANLPSPDLLNDCMLPPCTWHAFPRYPRMHRCLGVCPVMTPAAESWNPYIQPSDCLSHHSCHIDGLNYAPHAGPGDRNPLARALALQLWPNDCLNLFRARSGRPGKSHSSEPDVRRPDYAERMVRVKRRLPSGRGRADRQASRLLPGRRCPRSADPACCSPARRTTASAVAAKARTWSPGLPSPPTVR